MTTLDIHAFFDRSFGGSKLEKYVSHSLSRRSFLGTAIAALIGHTELLHAAGVRRAAPGPHPTPRVGITGAKVLTKEQLANKPQLIPLFDSVREAPEIIDGIRCNCGCASTSGFYSLLSCYEGDAMAKDCGVCQGQGRLATRLHKLGKSLEEIRAAIDAKYA